MARIFAIRSLSSKLIILFIVLGLCFVFFLSIALKHSFRNSFQHKIKPHLLAYVSYVRDDIGMPPNLERAKQLSQQLNMRIGIVGKDIRWFSDQHDWPIDKLEFHKKAKTKQFNLQFAHYRESDFLVLSQQGYKIYFANQFLPEAWNYKRSLPFLVMLLLLLVLYLVAKYLLSPIKTISQGIAEYSQGNFDHSIEVKRKDELAILADSINAMAQKIKHMLEAKRQLLLAMSHELRSPITRAKLRLEMLPVNNEKDAEQVAALKAELDEMAALIEELLEGERLNNHQSLHYQELEIKQLCEQLLADFFEPNKVQFECDRNFLVAVDKTRIRLLIKNLLQNALRFTPPERAKPILKIIDRDTKFRIQLEDFGIGIDAQHLPHLTEPFYRVDQSRQRKTGGYGLGLYLCQMIAKAHQGSLQLSSELNKGTTIRIELPKKPKA